MVYGGGSKNTVFAYDMNEALDDSGNSSMANPFTYAEPNTAADIPDGALYAGDYLEYTIYVGAKADSLIPMQHFDARFSVEKGQRIVGWEVMSDRDADGNVTKVYNSIGNPYEQDERRPITTVGGVTDDDGKVIAGKQYADVTAMLMGDEQTFTYSYDASGNPVVDAAGANTFTGAPVTMSNAPESTDLTRLAHTGYVNLPLQDTDESGEVSLSDSYKEAPITVNPDANGEYIAENRTIIFSVGSRTQLSYPGQGVYIRVITQMTDELETVEDYNTIDNLAFNGDAERPSYSAAQVRATLSATALPLHGYTQYRVEQSDTVGEGVFKTAYDEGIDGIRFSHPNDVTANISNRSQYGAVAESRVRFYSHQGGAHAVIASGQSADSPLDANGRPRTTTSSRMTTVGDNHQGDVSITAAWVHDSATRRKQADQDGNPMKMVVAGLSNPTWHNNDIRVTVRFTNSFDETTQRPYGRQIFEFYGHDIAYPATLPDNTTSGIVPQNTYPVVQLADEVADQYKITSPGRQNIKIEYYVPLNSDADLAKMQAVADANAGAVDFVHNTADATAENYAIVGAWIREDQDVNALTQYMAGREHTVAGTANVFTGNSVLGTDTRGVYDINLYRETQAMRWTYFDIPSSINGYTPFALPNVTLNGVGRYTDERLGNALFTEAANSVNGNFAVDVAYTHHHNESTLVDFRGPLYQAPDAAVEHGEWRTKQNEWKTSNTLSVYRRSPNIQFQSQVFQTHEEAVATYNENAEQKTGYVPGETFWYRDTLMNAALAVSSSTGSTSGWAAGSDGDYYSTNHGHSTESWMSTNFTIYSDTVVSFDFYVSSESGYDRIYWRFNKDGSIGSTMGGYSGYYGWTRMAYTLAPGNYTLQFWYHKDGSVNRGDDRAGVRNIKVGDGTAVGQTEGGLVDGDVLYGQTIGDTGLKMQPFSIQGTQEQSAGEGELYNAVFYERIPLDYLKQAAKYAYTDTATISQKNGTDIDAQYLENVLNARNEDGSLANVTWTDRFHQDVTDLRTRGLKAKVTLVGTTTEAADYGGSMNYTSRPLGICTYVSANQPCLYGGQSVYTSGKTYNDINPRAEGVSNTTTFGLFRVEWVVDDSVAGGYITDPGEKRVVGGAEVASGTGESRFLPDNELNTGSQLDTINRTLRPVDRPDYTSNVVEVGDTLSIAIPMRAATENLPQVYKNLDDSTTTAKNADGTPNTTGMEPAFMPRLGEYYYSSYHLHCGHTGCAAGNFFVSPGPGVDDFNLSNNMTGTMRVQTQNVLLDMDSLLRESAVTADKPKHVDIHRMFNYALTFIPGSASNVRKNGSGAIGENVTNTTNWEYSNNYGSSGSDNQLVDADVMTANNRQKVTYLLTEKLPAGATVDMARTSLPLSYSYVTAGQTRTTGSTDSGYVVRDYFRYVTASRIADALATAAGGRATSVQDLKVSMADTGAAALADGTTVSGAKATSATPLVWSETRMHMQKAWLATTSEMVSDFDNGYGAMNGTDDYQAARVYNHATTLSNGSLTGLTTFNTAADVNYTDPNKFCYDSGANYLTHWQAAADPTIEFGQYDDALEYGQSYTSQLIAYNYGDRNLDGVSFTYIMPRGVEPELVRDEEGNYVTDEDGNYKISVGAELLKSVNGAYTGAGHAANDGAPYVDETYLPIDDDLVQVEVLQTPYGTYQGYDAPSAKQDPATYRTGNTTNVGTDYSVTVEQATYQPINATTGAESVLGAAAGSDKVDPALMQGKAYTQSSQPWVIRVTVKQTLGKWFGRNIDSRAANAADPDPVSMAECYTQGGYKIRVNLDSHIFGNNEDEAWYDRLLTAPWDDVAHTADATGALAGEFPDAATSGEAAVEEAYAPVAADAIAALPEGTVLYVRDDADGTYTTATADQIADAAVQKYQRTAEAAAAVAATEPFNSSAYYQIYDVDLYEGNAAVPGRRQNVQPYGMDYSWTPMNKSRLGVHAPGYGQFYGSPNFPAINGYTVMNNSVVQDASVAGDNEARASLSNMGMRIMDSGRMTYVAANAETGERGHMAWTGGVDQADALKGGAVVYAQTGTHALMRKPFVRVWNTVSDYVESEGTVDADTGVKSGNTSDAIQADNVNYYVDTEADRRQLNVHVENRYWLNDQPYNFQRYMNTGYRYGPDGGYYTFSSKYHNNYAVDGGQKGTLTLPVVTVVLPFGVAPLLKSTNQPAWPVDAYEGGSATGSDGQASAVLPAQGTIDASDWDISMVEGADSSNYTNLAATAAPADDPTGYQTLKSVNDNLSDAWKQANFKVTYSFEPVTSDDGSVEYRYVVRFEPTADGYNSDRDLVTSIVNNGLATFKLNIMTYAEPKQGIDPAVTSRSYDNIRAFVTSKLDGFKYLVDEDITVANATDEARTEQPGGNKGGVSASTSVAGPAKLNPFTVGSEAQLTREQRMTWLYYRAVCSNWGNISTSTYYNTLHGLGWHAADKRLDASQSTYYTYNNLCGCGHEYSVNVNKVGVIPTNRVSTGNFTSESVPLNYLIGFNGRYTENQGAGGVAYGTQRVPRSMGGTGLAARLPLRGVDTVATDKNGRTFTTPIAQGKGLSVADYTYADVQWGLSSAITNSMNRGSVRPAAGDDVDTLATHVEPFANRFYTDEVTRLAEQTHIDSGVYSTVKLRTKVPTLNVDYEVEANPTNRPSDDLTKLTGAAIDPATGLPELGTDATGAGAGEGDIIKTDGSVIHAPRNTSAYNSATGRYDAVVERVMDDANGNEMVKVREVTNSVTGAVTTTVVQRDSSGKLVASGVRVTDNGNVTLKLKQYAADGVTVAWSLDKTFKLDKTLTADNKEAWELSESLAHLYMGDYDTAGNNYVATESYRRKKTVTLGTATGAKPVSAAGVTFYTRTATYVPLEIDYKGIIYYKRTDGSGNVVYKPASEVTDATSAETQYMDDESQAIYTPIARTTAALQNAYSKGTQLYVAEGAGYVRVKINKLPPVTKPYVDPYSFFSYGLPDLGSIEATGATFYTKEADGSFKKLELKDERDYATAASASARDTYIKLELNGQDEYVLAKLHSKGLPELSEYTFTSDSDSTERAMDSLTLYEYVTESHQATDANGDPLEDANGDPVMVTTSSYQPVVLDKSNIAKYTVSTGTEDPVKLYRQSYDDTGSMCYEEIRIKHTPVAASEKYNYTVNDMGRIVPVAYRTPSVGHDPDPYTVFYVLSGYEQNPVYETNPDGSAKTDADGKPIQATDPNTGDPMTEDDYTRPIYTEISKTANLDDYLDEFADQLYVKLNLSGEDRYVEVDLTRDAETPVDPEPDAYEQFQYIPEQTVSNVRYTPKRKVEFVAGIKSPDLDENGNNLITTDVYTVDDYQLNWVSQKRPLLQGERVHVRPVAARHVRHGQRLGAP